MRVNSSISVIIPIYNAEEYLHRCLDSLINQSYTNFEVLLVNDGSIDHSEDICKEFQQKDSRFKLLNKSNGGVSSARNIGLKYAKGEWIYFLDADDWLELNAFEKLLSEIGNSDYIRHSFSDFIDQQTNKKIPHQLSPAQNKKTYLQQIVSRKTVLGVCGGLYKREFTKDLTFDENISCGEDWLFLTQYILRVENIKVINDPLYVYNRINESSCTNSFSRKKLDDTLYSLETINRLIDPASHTQKNIAFYDIIYHFLFCLLRLDSNQLNSEDYEYLIKKKHNSLMDLLITPISLQKKFILLFGLNKITFKLMQKLYYFTHK